MKKPKIKSHPQEKYTKNSIFKTDNSSRYKDKKSNVVMNSNKEDEYDENSVLEFDSSEFNESPENTEKTNNVADLSKKIQEALNDDFQNSSSFKKPEPLKKKNKNKICCAMS